MDKFNEHMQKNGIEGLLPQNLSNDILNRMLIEIESYEKNNGAVPASTLLMAVLSIESGDIIKDGIDRIEVNFSSEDDLMDKFNSYTMCVTLEGLRRHTSVYMPDDALPTLKNIFDKNRKIQISGLD